MSGREVIEGMARVLDGDTVEVRCDSSLKVVESARNRRAGLSKLTEFSGSCLVEVCTWPGNWTWSAQPHCAPSFYRSTQVHTGPQCVYTGLAPHHPFIVQVEGVRIRFFGVDAPEWDQKMVRDGVEYPCGETTTALLHLVCLLLGNLLQKSLGKQTSAHCCPCCLRGILSGQIAKRELADRIGGEPVRCEVRCAPPPCTAAWVESSPASHSERDSTLLEDRTSCY